MRGFTKLNCFHFEFSKASLVSQCASGDGNPATPALAPVFCNILHNISAQFLSAAHPVHAVDYLIRYSVSVTSSPLASCRPHHPPNPPPHPTTTTTDSCHLSWEAVCLVCGKSRCPGRRCAALEAPEAASTPRGKKKKKTTLKKKKENKRPAVAVCLSFSLSQQAGQQLRPLVEVLKGTSQLFFPFDGECRRSALKVGRQSCYAGVGGGLREGGLRVVEKMHK